jgi:hypothetical protein
VKALESVSSPPDHRSRIVLVLTALVQRARVGLTALLPIAVFSHALGGSATENHAQQVTMCGREPAVHPLARPATVLRKNSRSYCRNLRRSVGCVAPPRSRGLAGGYLRAPGAEGHQLPLLDPAQATELWLHQLLICGVVLQCAQQQQQSPPRVVSVASGPPTAASHSQHQLPSQSLAAAQQLTVKLVSLPTKWSTRQLRTW